MKRIYKSEWCSKRKREGGGKEVEGGRIMCVTAWDKRFYREETNKIMNDRNVWEVLGCVPVNENELTTLYHVCGNPLYDIPIMWNCVWGGETSNYLKEGCGERWKLILFFLSFSLFYLWHLAIPTTPFVVKWWWW